MASDSDKLNLIDKPFSVEAPFDSDLRADVILVSSDGHRFRVRKAILTFVSPIFDDMFSLPQPNDTIGGLRLGDGLPVVNLSETGTVIDALLRHCYPTLSQSLEDEDIIAVFSAATKYGIDLIEAGLKTHRLEKPKYLLALYKNACYHGL